VTDAPAKNFYPVRTWLFRLAWLLLAVSLLIPAPGLPFADPNGFSAVQVYRMAAAWNTAAPGSALSLGFWQGAVLALALYSTIAFLYSLYLPSDRGIVPAWKVLLLIAIAVDASIAFLVPELAHLPAYWIWLASIAALTVGYVALSGPVAAQGAKPPDAPAEIDRGEVPKFAWVILAFTLFWVAVSAVNHAYPPDAALLATRDSLTGYVNDRAHLLKPGEVSQLTETLQTLEARTPSQIAIAIYPRAPTGSIDDFTIRTAEHFPLGRAGLDTGAILFVFMDDRTARLEVGYGLEGSLTDADSHRILAADLAPAFARGAYFDGLNATLSAIFAQVKDTYTQTRVPEGTTAWKRKLGAQRPTKLERVWRAISEASLAVRVGTTLLLALVSTAIWNMAWHRPRLARAVGRGGTMRASASDWGSFARDIGRGVSNLRAKRPFAEGMERFDVSTIWDTVRLIFWTLGILIPAAGIVLIAGGGEFGGAGALIRW
jgi:uncharacterized membrane protein YgcG